MDKELDAQTAERINALAKSFKDLHLATTTEEAYARAKEIILGTKKEQAADFTMEQTIGELMHSDREEKEKLKKAVGDLEVYERQEKAEAKETEEELAEVEKELSAEENEIDDIKEIVEEAEKAEKVSEESSD
jgi:hypothetical protein